MRKVQGFVSGRVQGVGFRYFVMRHGESQGNVLGVAVGDLATIVKTVDGGSTWVEVPSNLLD